MQSRQTFMAAMGGVDPGEEGYGEYDEARRRSAHPPAFVYALLNTRACARPSRRETSPWTGSEGSRRPVHGPSRPGVTAAGVEFTAVGLVGDLEARYSMGCKSLSLSFSLSLSSLKIR